MIPSRSIASLKPEVGHHGRDDGVVAQRARLPHGQREDGQDLVAVDDGAGGVDGEAAVGVAVVGDAEVGAVLDDGGLAAARGGWSRSRR